MIGFKSHTAAVAGALTVATALLLSCVFMAAVSTVVLRAGVAAVAGVVWSTSAAATVAAVLSTDLLVNFFMAAVSYVMWHSVPLGNVALRSLLLLPSGLYYFILLTACQSFLLRFVVSFPSAYYLILSFRVCQQLCSFLSLHGFRWSTCKTSLGKTILLLSRLGLSLLGL
jgi:hypothetical protein